VTGKLHKRRKLIPGIGNLIKLLRISAGSGKRAGAGICLSVAILSYL
jgi:hypothetical protein